MCNSGLYWVPNAINQIIHFILIPSLPRIGGKILSLSQWDSLVAQLVKNPPAMRETWVRALGWEDPLEKERLPTPVFWPGEFHGLYSPWHRKESDTTE